MKKAWVLSYLLSAQRKPLNWVFAGRTCHFDGFVMMRLICTLLSQNEFLQESHVCKKIFALLIDGRNVYTTEKSWGLDLCKKCVTASI